MINLSSFFHASTEVDNEPNMATRNNGTWEVSEPIYPKSARYNITEIFRGHCLHWNTTMKWLLQGSTPLGFLHIAKKKWLHILQWESPLCSVVLGKKKKGGKKKKEMVPCWPGLQAQSLIEMWSYYLDWEKKMSTSLKGDRMSAEKRVKIKKVLQVSNQMFG